MNSNNEHAQDHFCPRVTFEFCRHGEKLSRQGGVTRCCITGNTPLGAAPGQQKTRVNSYRRQTMHRGKVRPGVSESSWGNDFSRDALNDEKFVSSYFYHFSTVWLTSHPRSWFYWTQELLVPAEKFTVSPSRNLLFVPCSMKSKKDTFRHAQYT